MGDISGLPPNQSTQPGCIKQSHLKTGKKAEDFQLKSDQDQAQVWVIDLFPGSDH